MNATLNFPAPSLGTQKKRLDHHLNIGAFTHEHGVKIHKEHIQITQSTLPTRDDQR